MPFEIDFLPVGDGNGDAICVQYSTPAGYVVHLVDGGYTSTADTIIDHIDGYYGRDWFINNVIMTHADDDHAIGLVDVMERRRVAHLWMNRPWLWADLCSYCFHANFTSEGLVDEIRSRHPHLVKLEELAAAQGTEIHDVFQGTWIGNFVVLAPSFARYVSLIPDLDKTPTNYAEDSRLAKAFLEGLETTMPEWWDLETLSNYPQACTASNESSVVQMGILDGKHILLTGDAGPEALNEAIAYAEAIGLYKEKYPDFVQVPHHGSRRNVTPTVLDRMIGPKVEAGKAYGLAYCSVGKAKTDYPRGQVQNAFQRRGYPVYATRSQTKSYRNGFDSRYGWVAATPEPWVARVKA